MREATNQPTTLTPTTRRRVAKLATIPPTPVTNVVTLPKRLTGADAIVAEVQARSKQQSESLIARMEEITTALRARQLERAKELIPLAMKMDRPMVDDLVEIAQRMLASRGRA